MSNSPSGMIDLPVVWLTEGVLFPGATATLVLQGSYATSACAAARLSDSKVFVVTERPGEQGLGDGDDAPDPEGLFAVGVVARCVDAVSRLDCVDVVTVGEYRAVAESYEHKAEGYLEARVQRAEETGPVAPNAPAFLALLEELRERTIRFTECFGSDGDVTDRILHAVREPGALADLVANALRLDVAQQQAILEELNVERRLWGVLSHLSKQLDILDAQVRLREQVARELGHQQRELFLREQMKAIRKQLGEEQPGGEIAKLAEQLSALELPTVARAEVDRGLTRLHRLQPESAEAQVVRTHLEWIAELPWNRRTEDSLDLDEAERILDENHYGLDDVKDRVLELLAVRKLRARRALRQDDRGPRSRILVFVGPPGVGKTSITTAIAEAMGRKHVRIALGGVRDEADIRGHRRTYVGAMPGRIVHGLRQAGTKNPVFVIDEVDKLGVSLQGDPASALLEVLDPGQNDTFTDHYLDVPFDLSEVFFIATGNFEDRIPEALRDRMDVVRFSGYTEGEKLEIAKRYLVPRQVDDAGLDELRFDDEALLTMIREHTHESGVRQLERRIGAIAGKLARRVASGHEIADPVGSAAVRELLGRPLSYPEPAATHSQVGVATGLYCTSAGGAIMFVEASLRNLDHGGDGVPGGVELILTGQLGEVMRESARAAVTYALTHAPRRGQLRVRPGPLEAHVHVPAGAVPKDGPSAGVTVAVAVSSALLGLPVRYDVAMTGEITLRGRVLPVGGVKEKVLGAARAGIVEVALPADNAVELEDVPTELRERMRFHAVATIDDVLDIVLRPDEPTVANERVDPGRPART